MKYNIHPKTGIITIDNTNLHDILYVEIRYTYRDIKTIHGSIKGYSIPPNKHLHILVHKADTRILYSHYKLQFRQWKPDPVYWNLRFTLINND